ncbi:MAG: sugar phosphorylase [Caldithrix sp.]|nr:sugar phosphorylase [Caldithrix sp.]
MTSGPSEGFNKTSSFDHYLEPDYERPLLNIPAEGKELLRKRLTTLYGSKRANQAYPELERLLKVYYAHKTPQMIDREAKLSKNNRLTERDVILITYGDLIINQHEQPLKTIARLGERYLHNVFNTIHILPFFPYSSDRGFSVMDFEEVDPKLGSWEDILDLKRNFKLMFDGVFNHVSSKSRWFQEFLNQNPEFTDFFTVFSTKEQISPDHLKVIVRPRTSDILSSFPTLNGVRLVWTTFSSDQIDLNYNNPKVLLKMVDILLAYIRKGADLIRLDAVTYLWEELGTTCAHLDETHETIKLFRNILDIVAPHVVLITETNVPHRDNIKYFGNGYNEAQMVYNFALPPLVLYTFLTEDSHKLSEWASDLKKISDQATYFNFLDSHDGVGVMAAKDILDSSQIDWMGLKVIEHGGYISYKDNGDGTESPYEFNITWFSAINNLDADESLELQVDRYIASRSIALVLRGVPGVYFHGLLGSRNDAELVIEERQTRSINRKTINENDLVQALESPQTSTHQVTTRLVKLIRKRIQQPAFHPNASQKILNLGKSFFAVLRTARDDQSAILAITNVAGRPQSTAFHLNKDLKKFDQVTELISDTTISATGQQLQLNFKPFQVMWLKSATGIQQPDTE